MADQASIDGELTFSRGKVFRLPESSVEERSSLFFFCFTSILFAGLLVSLSVVDERETISVVVDGAMGRGESDSELMTFIVPLRLSAEADGYMISISP